MFAKKLSISWIDNDQYWRWIEENDTRYIKPSNIYMEIFVVLAQILFNLIFFFNLTWLYSGEVIEMAELLGVCWLNIEGKIRTIDLSPGTEYEVVFVVKMNGYQKTWKNSVTLMIILPSSKSLTRSENLSGKPVGIWIDVKVGEFRMTPENVGEITFKMGEYSSEWKGGLVLKCAIIRPKKDQPHGC